MFSVKYSFFKKITYFVVLYRIKFTTRGFRPNYRNFQILFLSFNYLTDNVLLYLVDRPVTIVRRIAFI